MDMWAILHKLENAAQLAIEGESIDAAQILIDALPDMRATLLANIGEQDDHIYLRAGVIIGDIQDDGIPVTVSSWEELGTVADTGEYLRRAEYTDPDSDGYASAVAMTVAVVDKWLRERAEVQ